MAAEEAALASKSESHSPHQPLHGRGLSFFICKMASELSYMNLGVGSMSSQQHGGAGTRTQTTRKQAEPHPGRAKAGMRPWG